MFDRDGQALYGFGRGPLSAFCHHTGRSAQLIRIRDTKHGFRKLASLAARKPKTENRGCGPVSHAVPRPIDPFITNKTTAVRHTTKHSRPNASSQWGSRVVGAYTHHNHHITPTSLAYSCCYIGSALWLLISAATLIRWLDAETKATLLLLGTLAGSQNVEFVSTGPLHTEWTQGLELVLSLITTAAAWWGGD